MGERVFQDSSINFFDYSSSSWIFDDSIFYIGTYIFDINGKYYRTIEHWAGDEDNKFEKKTDYQQIREIFDFEQVLDNNYHKQTITEFIQKQFLSIKGQILHLFIDEYGKNIYEILNPTGDIPNVSFSSTQYYDIFPLLTKLGVQHKEIIIRTFDFHFDLIKKVPFSHLYFFPTVLELLNAVHILNVTTTIGPSKLGDEEVNTILFGLESSASRLLADTAKHLYLLAQDEAIKSAKAAIMSRNMSHNIGSHVMSYLKQQIGTTDAIFAEDSKVLSNLIPEKIAPDIINTAKIEMPFLIGLGRFLGYLQERQDFIATIATDFIPSESPVNLKDAIYDELNPDLRFLRHKISDDSNQESCCPTNILLNYIAKSEGLSRENMTSDFKSKNDIRIGYIKYFRRGYSVFGFDSFESTDEALAEMRKINLCLPGGLIGRQAIFSIIENLIRNAAKHGDRTNSSNLDFTIDVIDGDLVAKRKCPQWSTRIQDPQWRKLYNQASDISDLYIITITDNLTYSSDDVIKRLRDKALSENYIEDGVMTISNKGIKEIRISAAWLRGKTDESCYYKYRDETQDGSKRNAPLVAIEMAKTTDAYSHLRYAFCVKKNKMIAVVREVEGVSIDNMDDFEKLKQRDGVTWNILSEEDLIKQKSCYSFILIPNSEKAYRKLRPITSNRLCRWVPPSNNKVMAKKETALTYIYQLFTGLNKDSEDITIWDGVAYNSHSRERKFDKIHVEAFDKISGTPQYIYRKHHSSEKDYLNFCRNNWKKWKYDCVEGITGDNSSDRLIRREPLDEKWYYAHLYAMKKKVAVIDERIFKMIHNIDESKFVVQKNGTNHFAEIIGGNYKSSYFHDKGVDVYSVRDNGNGEMILVGCVKISFNGISFENTFDKIATFKRSDDSTFKIDIVEKYKRLFLNSYDYISIHQGILDKVYENLRIKDNCSEKNKITSDIYGMMMRNPDPIGDYLPNFIIHSGRAKPSSDDMPQHQPFIQYSAIENAVKDCKLIMVELFDHAKYEKNILD